MANPQKYLVLETIPKYPHHWIVQSLSNTFQFDLEEVLGPDSTIGPESLEEFLTICKELNYEPIFADDPRDLLEYYYNLDNTPDIQLKSHFPNTVNGLLPYQVRAYNFFKDLEAGYMAISTGCGKGTIATAILRHYIALDDFDFAFFIVKSNNRVNTQRALFRLAEIDALIVDGPNERRKKLYSDLLEAPSAPVIITNYEKFRTDYVHLKPFFNDSRLLIFLDEASNKLRNRDTKLYRAYRNLIFKKKFGEWRPRQIRQFALSATPIENSPEDFFNVMRLLDPTILGTIPDFRNEYVQSYNPFSNKPSTWRNLDKLGLRTSTVVYQIDKKDPEIAKQFPAVVETPLFIDWNPTDRQIYEKLQHEAQQIFNLDGSEAVFPLIMLMQMMCDMPSAINRSRDQYHDWISEKLAGLDTPKRGSTYADQFIAAVGELRDDRHTKLETIRELLLEKHSNEKILIFSTFNHLVLPALSDLFDQWEVSHVVYSGTDVQKQKAQDAFQTNDDIQVFLSSDAGSDSISLEEASVCIHMNLPWKMSTFIQRQNRAHRITSEHHKVTFYTLSMVDSVEDRKKQIIDRKQSYYDQIFVPGQISQTTYNDLQYILFG